MRTLKQGCGANDVLESPGEMIQPEVENQEQSAVSRRNPDRVRSDQVLESEAEDAAAVIEAVGRSAYAYGHSSRFSSHRSPS